MQRRSQGPPTHYIDQEINRTLRQVRRLYRKEGRGLGAIFDSESESWSSSSQSEELARQENDVLFREFGNPEDYQLTGGILLPVTETNITIHPQYTRMSLSDRAKKWLKQVKPNSLTTWREVVKAFLKRFISEEKTAEMRRKIASFEQEADESLSEAWERFKELLQACPHHEYNQSLLMRFFYDGLEPMYRANLDAGAGGQLIKVTQNQVEETIEEVVKNYSWGVRMRNTPKKCGKYELEKVNQLQHQVERLTKGLAKLNISVISGASSSQVNSFSCQNCGGTNHDTSYCGGLSPEHVATYNTRQDGYRGSGGGRVPFNSPSTLPRQSQTNPSNIVKPDSCKAITLRLGTSYEGPKDEDSENKKEGEESVSQDKEVEEEKVVEKERSMEEKKSKDVVTYLTSSEARNLSRPVPFPGRLEERKLNDKFARFLSVMKNLHINLPFIEVVTQMPSYSKFLKYILTNKKKLNDELITLPHQLSALVQHKMPKKKKYLGSFTLTVKIGNMEAKGALADLGASVSLIPLSIAQKLNIEMIPTRKTIQLADRSVKVPCGELEEVPIQVRHIYVPCDFVVMDMEEDVDNPLILGREALKTLGVVINCKNNTITYRLGRVMMSPQDPMVEALTCEEEYHSQEAKEFVMAIEEAKNEEEEDPRDDELELADGKLEETKRTRAHILEQARHIPLPHSESSSSDEEGECNF
ncbi:uncharacterized protein LOC110695797 [Chenopodium quinoa]|uniref:uncharacterized protein LOC110695797 n=1 Tax=Chenopodium quinoa TaxID=63459 RepID=UPI000B788AF2|nr:uncharacterized protein LOC110695797 [Chenopodium quinoa]